MLSLMARKHAWAIAACLSILAACGDSSQETDADPLADPPKAMTIALAAR